MCNTPTHTLKAHIRYVRHANYKCFLCVSCRVHPKYCKKLPGKSSLNVRSAHPVCPDDHDEHDCNDKHNHDK